MKQCIYKSWVHNLNQWFFIEEEFTKNDFQANFYNAVLKTMRYISANLHYANDDFKQSLKKDLLEVREYYLNNKL